MDIFSCMHSVFRCLFTLIGKDQQMDEGIGNLVKSIPISFDPATSEKNLLAYARLQEQLLFKQIQHIKIYFNKVDNIQEVDFLPIYKHLQITGINHNLPMGPKHDGSGNTEPQTKMFECYPNKSFCVKPC